MIWAQGQIGDYGIEKKYQQTDSMAYYSFVYNKEDIANLQRKDGLFNKSYWDYWIATEKILNWASHILYIYMIYTGIYSKWTRG